MRTKLLMLSLVALLVPAVSQAQVSLGLRVGYAPAMGDFAKDAAMSDAVKSQIPIQLDALYNVNKDVAVGGYFSYGIGQVGDSGCDISGVDCSANVMRFGVQGLYTFNQVAAPLVPWAGVGFGYEMSGLEAKYPGGNFTADTSGFEFLNLQLGGDYRVSEKFAIGPYLQFSIGQYSKVKFEDSTDPTENFDGDIEEKAIHEWFGFGIRGKFDL